MNKALCFVIAIYRRFISPLTGNACRFHPTCSEYALQALQAKGTLKGLLLAAVRITKCHPFHPGGYDPIGTRTPA